MTIRPELIDELLKNCQNPKEILGEAGILKQLTRIDRGTLKRKQR